jgi:ech hydrogenase subunit D
MSDELIQIQPGELSAKAAELKKEGWRLVQMSAVVPPVGEGETPSVELTVSFDLGYKLRNLRLTVPHGARLQSVSSVYFPAFLYENEIHEQFGLEFDGMAVDFRGTLYKTAVKQPFVIQAAKKAKPAQQAAPAQQASPSVQPQNPAQGAK